MSPRTPLVLLHAYPLNGGMWKGVAAALTGERAILAPDFPGFGDAEPGPQSLDGFADAVIGALDAAAIEKAVFVGLSMGGYVLFRLQERYPERIAALVLADTRATPDDEAGRRKRTDQAERARREGVGWIPDLMLPDMIAPEALENAEVVARVRRLMQEASGEGVARALLAIRDRPDSTPRLQKIDVPVLAIVGDQDKVTPVAEARRIAEGVPNGELHVIEGAGHLSALEKPREFAAAVDAFLQGHNL